MGKTHDTRDSSFLTHTKKSHRIISRSAAAPLARARADLSPTSIKKISECARVCVRSARSKKRRARVRVCVCVYPSVSISLAFGFLLEYYIAGEPRLDDCQVLRVDVEREQLDAAFAARLKDWRVPLEGPRPTHLPVRLQFQSVQIDLPARVRVQRGLEPTPNDRYAILSFLLDSYRRSRFLSFPFGNEGEYSERATGHARVRVSSRSSKVSTLVYDTLSKFNGIPKSIPSLDAGGNLRCTASRPTHSGRRDSPPIHIYPTRRKNASRKRV